MTTFGPFAEKKFIEIKGRKMAYIDEGEGDPIVFQHGKSHLVLSLAQDHAVLPWAGTAHRLRPDRYG